MRGGKAGTVKGSSHRAVGKRAHAAGRLDGKWEDVWPARVRTSQTLRLSVIVESTSAIRQLDSWTIGTQAKKSYHRARMFTSTTCIKQKSWMMRSRQRVRA